MQSVKRYCTLCFLVLLAGIFTLLPAVGVSAQDMMEEKVACDSTLITLLLVAEHDYDYLSAKMMDEAMMDSPALKIDKGQYTSLFDSITAMMMAMMEEEAMMEETTDMEAHDAMLNEMMMMSPADMLAAYMSSMNMDMMEGETMLAAGAVAGEDPICAEVRNDVERFILAHLITEMSMMDMMEEGQ